MPVFFFLLFTPFILGFDTEQHALVCSIVVECIGGALEDLGNAVNGWLGDATNSPLATVLGAVCGAVIVGGGVAGLIWVFRWVFGRGSSGNKRRRR